MIQKYGSANDLIAGQGCYLCRRTDNLISTGVQIEAEGILALCPACIHDLAVAADYVVDQREELNELAAELGVAQNELVERERERDALQARLDEVGDLFVAAVERREQQDA